MKFTISEYITRINQILNYPSVAFEDIYHFFDQAIAELNTTLKIAIAPVTEMIKENTIHVTEQENCVHLPNLTAYTIHKFTEIPVEAPADSDPTFGYYCTDTHLQDAAFYMYGSNGWTKYANLYGMFIDASHDLRTFVAVPVSKDVACWSACEPYIRDDFDVEEYLPHEWWTLFVIPYVCYKFSTRNGLSGEQYLNEFVQGLQQLQTSYGVPNTVLLSLYAGRKAYETLVKENLPNLNKRVFTKAIYNDMRIGDAVAATFGGFNDAGGWGI